MKEAYKNVEKLVSRRKFKLAQINKIKQRKRKA